MEWLIYNLVGDVLTHYWYKVQCKKFGYVRNKKQEGVITDTSSWYSKYKCLITPRWGGHYICGIHQPPGKSVNHTRPSFKMAAMWLPLEAQGIVCKHVMKVFKMFHPNIRDGSIVREISTLHGVTRGGAILEHNNLECGLGNDDTKDHYYKSMVFLLLTLWLRWLYNHDIG